MTSPTQTEPPFVPLRHSGWATKRTPLWVFCALAVLVAGGFLVALSVRPVAVAAGRRPAGLLRGRVHRGRVVRGRAARLDDVV